MIRKTIPQLQINLLFILIKQRKHTRRFALRITLELTSKFSSCCTHQNHIPQKPAHEAFASLSTTAIGQIKRTTCKTHSKEIHNMSSSSGFQRMVQYFWDKDLENTDLENPIVVLGNEYRTDAQSLQQEDANETVEQSDESNNETPLNELKQYFNTFSFKSSSKNKDSIDWPKEFLDDVYTRLWFTYRTRFSPLQKDKDGPSPLSLNNLLRAHNYDLHNEFFTTDCGWGCMIRTGQTLLANTLLTLQLGRDWRFDESKESTEHKQIVSLFIDTPQNPFSIHNFVEKGRKLSGKKAGEWFGPSATARSIQALCADFATGLNVYIGSDSGDIYEQDLFKIAKEEDGVFKPILILLGVRLGVDNVNSIYWKNLKRILASSESVGISGGRPSSSHYFFGFQGDYLFYLDPHLPQPALKEESNLEESISESTEIVSFLDIQSVHTRKLRKLHLSEVDPSMLLGFLIRDEDEWINWKERIINDKDNKIIHISSNQSITQLFKRKPSFVIYDEEGGDFVDVGLDIEDLHDESAELDVASDINVVNEEDARESSIDRSVIILSKDHSVEELLQTEPVIGSFEEYSGTIKEEEYENIATSTTTAAFDDSTVEVESFKGEEPYVIDKSDVSIIEDV